MAFDIVRIVWRGQYQRQTFKPSNRSRQISKKNCASNETLKKCRYFPFLLILSTSLQTTFRKWEQQRCVVIKHVLLGNSSQAILQQTSIYSLSVILLNALHIACRFAKLKSVTTPPKTGHLLCASQKQRKSCKIRNEIWILHSARMQPFQIWGAFVWWW